MEVLEVENYRDLLEAQEQDIAEVQNPQKKTKIVLKEDIMIKHELNFKNVVISSDEEVRTLKYENICGVNITIEKVHLKERDEYSNYILSDKGNQSLSVSGLTIRKSFFDEITLYESEYIEIKHCKGKRMDIVKSSDINMEDVKFSHGIWDEESALKIDGCKDVELSEVIGDYDEEDSCPTFISLFESSSILIKEGSVEEAGQGFYIADCESTELRNLRVENCRKALTSRGSEVFFDSIELENNEEPIQEEDIKMSEVDVNDTPEIIAVTI